MIVGSTPFSVAIWALARVDTAALMAKPRVGGKANRRWARAPSPCQPPPLPEQLHLVPRLTAFLVCFESGGEAWGDVARVGGSSGATGGGNCLGGMGGGTNRIGVASQSVAASAGGGVSEHRALVAAGKRRWQRRWRRLVVVAMMLEKGGESKQVNEASYRPATWRKVKRALSPLAIKRSYRVRNSSLLTVDDGRVGGKIDGESLGHAPSRTILAHVGAAQESTPSTPNEGEAWGASIDPARLYLPSPSHGGEADWRGEY